VLSTAITAPAVAQDPVARSEAARQHQDRAYYHSPYYQSHRFWPGELAAGVVGGAIGTAGAIATAPFRNDSYAYNDGYYGQRYYGDFDNGFVCQPGTTFRGADGRRHICQ
jgi:hypothetical protein